MRKTSIPIAFTLLALAATACPLLGQDGKAKPTVWMGPPSFDNGKCFRELFEHPDAWKETRSVLDFTHKFVKRPVPSEIPIKPTGP